MAASLARLPEDCLRRVLYFVDGGGVVALHKVDHAWHRLARAEALLRLGRAPLPHLYHDDRIWPPRQEPLPLPLPAEVDEIHVKGTEWHELLMAAVDGHHDEEEKERRRFAASPTYTTEMFHVSNQQSLCVTSSGLDVIGGPRSFHTLFLFTAATWSWRRLPPPPFQYPRSSLCRTAGPPLWYIEETLVDEEVSEAVGMVFWSLRGDVWVSRPSLPGVIWQSATSPTLQSGEAYAAGREW